MITMPIPTKFSVLLLLTVQALSLASAGGGELLKNGGFREVGRRSGPWQQPRHWGMWESGKSEAEIDLTGIGIESGAGPDGQPALMVRGRGACFLQSVRGVQPGTRLRLTFWAMAELENGQLNVSLRFLGADGGYLAPREQPKSGSIVFRKSFGWRLCEADVQAPAAIGRDIVNVIVAPRLSGAERAGLAAMSLQIVPAAASTTRDDGKPLGFLSAKALPDIQVDLPTTDDSIAHIDFGTGESSGIKQVGSAGHAKRLLAVSCG